MDIIGDIFEVILQLGWSLLLLFLAAAIAFFIFVNLLKLTVWALILGGVTWLIFDSFWIGFVIGIILTIWIIKDMGFAEFIDPSELTSKDKAVYEDTEMPIPYEAVEVQVVLEKATMEVLPTSLLMNGIDRKTKWITYQVSCMKWSII